MNSALNGFHSETKQKPLKTVHADAPFLETGLKPGVNETTFEAKPMNSQMDQGAFLLGIPSRETLVKELDLVSFLRKTRVASNSKQNRKIFPALFREA